MNRNISFTFSLFSLFLYGTADYGLVNYSNLHPQIASIIASVLRVINPKQNEVGMTSVSVGFHLGQDEAIIIFLLSAMISSVIAFIFAYRMENTESISGLRKKMIALSIVTMFVPVHLFLVLKHLINV